ncbi:hypothetical protein N7510_004624 [Penicillium lagena]|uniref:uncharacterized protein n=1 Tax=Penicillium lagena TaxID=94218 RepID=UPI00253FA0C3|nr:uncharacterized protein N7510_004624 [Penicillium lagena]KAJ5620640.1 hypothetical protein N7510_004624 [Penicillium lagena]
MGQMVNPRPSMHTDTTNVSAPSCEDDLWRPGWETNRLSGSIIDGVDAEVGSVTVHSLYAGEVSLGVVVRLAVRLSTSRPGFSASGLGLDDHRSRPGSTQDYWAHAAAGPEVLALQSSPPSSAPPSHYPSVKVLLHMHAEDSPIMEGKPRAERVLVGNTMCRALIGAQL